MTPPTLIATSGAVNANSYLDVAAATLYLSGRLGTAAWDAADPATTQIQALLMATARLEQERFVGFKKSSSQALKWPRTFVPNGEQAGYGYFEGFFTPNWWDPALYFDDSTIPVPLQQATAELALWLLETAGSDGATNPFTPTGLEGYRDLAVASINVTPDNSRQARHRLPPQVERLLSLLLESNQPTRIVRG